jgi:serine protease Do
MPTGPLSERVEEVDCCMGLGTGWKRWFLFDVSKRMFCMRWMNLGTVWLSLMVTSCLSLAGWAALAAAEPLEKTAQAKPKEELRKAEVVRPETKEAEAETPVLEEDTDQEEEVEAAEAAERRVTQLARLMKRSLAKVTQEGREGVDGLGTGFVIAEEGLVATNLHVIGEARPLQVELADGRVLEVEAVHATDARLDLAILKVKVGPEGLPALKLGDSDRLEQGQKLVAMGNPEGLEFSVVEGVVSAIRETEIDGVPMLQVALPIERGNSGGPVLNARGEVVGVLTLKSLRTDNLGFAMPVNGLRSLVEKPNPVPMERWLTIGVLDKRQWEVIMGSRWSQRAGVIRAQTPGQGFGGRTLCLSRDEVPEEGDYEVGVSVRLVNESGAAGLVFCADGGDRHYGFYPSGGKLRLTRFDGADVYSWTILADVAVENYRREDWNALRVRVTEEELVCWVNGEQVLSVADTGLRGGRVGLCKFRDTEAEFRAFRKGQDLSPALLPAGLAEAVRTGLDGLLAGRTEPEALVETWVEDGSAMAAKRVLVERRRELEQAVVALRTMEKDLHRQAVTRDLVMELKKPEAQIPLLRCALLLARHDNAEVDVAEQMHSFRRLVEELKADPAIAKGGDAAVERLNTFLFEENGFHGSRQDYHSRSNSYVNEVLEDREGLPITLAVVYLELARELGVKEVFGVPLPGKFMVGFHPGPDAPLQLVDVFERGKRLSLEEAERELNDFVAFPPEMLQPATNKAIVLRMIKNLLSAALDDEDAANQALPYLNLVLALAPESPPERFARARLRQTEGDKSGAREDIQWLMDHGDDLPPGVREQLQEWHHSLRD